MDILDSVFGYGSMSMILSLFSTIIAIGAMLPVGVLIFIMWKYSKEKITTDKQLGIKIILNLFKYIGTTMVITGFAALFGVIFYSSIIKGLWRTLLPLILTGAAIYGISATLLSKKVNDNEFPQIRKAFTSLLTFNFFAAAAAGIFLFIVIPFQLNEYNTKMLQYLVGIACFTAVNAGAAFYFLNIRIAESKANNSAGV